MRYEVVKAIRKYIKFFVENEKLPSWVWISCIQIIEFILSILE